MVRNNLKATSRYEKLTNIKLWLIPVGIQRFVMPLLMIEM
jgi:hypothetical protein